MIYIFEITFPGSRLVAPDRDWAREVESLIRELETSLIDAALALSMFEVERSRPSPPHDPEEWERDSKRRQQLEENIARQLGVDRYDWEGYERVRNAASISLKREKWNAGEIPAAYDRRFVFLHARSYLFALDRFERTLSALSDMDAVPEAVRSLQGQLKACLPHLREVRNSVAHSEDRSRGLARSGKPIDLKPMANRFVHAPNARVLMTEGLFNNVFMSTMADGNHGEVEVSGDVLGKLQVVLQSLVNTFEWEGYSRHEPS